MDKIKINVKLDEGVKMPRYAHDSDAGADIFSNEDYVLKPQETHIFKTGVYMEIPENYRIDVRGKSGLNSKGLHVDGLVDEAYRGNIGVIMTNLGKEPYIIRKGDKIAQLLITTDHLQGVFNKVGEIDKNTDRGENGFGSTGK